MIRYSSISNGIGQKKKKTSGLDSTAHAILVKTTSKSLSIISVWEWDLSSIGSSENWPRIWHDILLPSRNLNHWVIYFSFIHGTYYTTLTLLKMKASVYELITPWTSFFKWEFPMCCRHLEQGYMSSTISSKPILDSPFVIKPRSFYQTDASGWIHSRETTDSL